MKQQNIIFILLIAAVAFTAVSTAMGWYILLEQDKQLISLSKQQTFARKKIIGLNESLVKLDAQMKKNTNNFSSLTKEFKSIEQAVNSGKLQDKELSMRIMDIGDKLQTWQLINDEVLNSIIDLGRGMDMLGDSTVFKQADASRQAPIKNIELGEVSIKKNIVPAGVEIR